MARLPLAHALLFVSVCDFRVIFLSYARFVSPVMLTSYLFMCSIRLLEVNRGLNDQDLPCKARVVPTLWLFGL